ncbi:MAG: DUF1819 family protein [Gemmatimonadaceae bacterium]|nr:DUF1819 family protein [Gemmatimonadaceae bacterium]
MQDAKCFANPESSPAKKWSDTMLARLKGVFQRALTEADLLHVIEHRIKTPPLSPEWLDVLATIRAKRDGGSLTELWRDRFRAKIREIASEPTWSLQRARVLRCIAETHGWTALHEATKEATNAEAWVDHFKEAFPEAAEASPETCNFLVLQHYVMALCTEACLVEIGSALYNVNQIKLLELQVLEAAHRETQVLQTRLRDRILTASRGDDDFRDALVEWHDEQCVPLLNAEWRSINALEEAVVADTFDVQKDARQAEALQEKLAAVLREMPVRIDEEVDH